MRYEHKEYIEQFLGIHDEDEQKELDEVYRKAERYDGVIEVLKERIELMDAEYEDYWWKKSLLKGETYAEILKELERDSQC